MSRRFDLPLDAGGRRFRRILGPALLASVAAHVALALAAAGTRITVGGESAAHAGPPPALQDDGMRAVDLPAVRREAVPRPPPPVVAPEPDLSGRPIVGSPRLSDVRLAAHGAPPPRLLGGAGDGSGRSASGGGADDRSSPAVPRSLFPAWDPPASVRGRTVTVRVHVDARGRPTGVVELDPSTPDEAFNRKLRDRVRRMAFRPARKNGEPVAAWAELTFEF